MSSIYDGIWEIVSVFDKIYNAEVFNPSESSIVVFNKTLDALSMLKHNPDIVRHGIFPPHKDAKISFNNSNEISINNFTIIEVNGLYPRAILNMYPEASTWSHPSVHTLLTFVLAPRYIFKQYLHDNLKSYLYPSIKLFINMIYGNILRPNKLYLNTEFDINIFRIEQQKIIDDVLDKLDIKNIVVCIDTDEILVPLDIGNIAKLKDKTIHSDKFDTDMDLWKLNALCRKFKINIIK